MPYRVFPSFPLVSFILDWLDEKMITLLYSDAINEKSLLKFTVIKILLINPVPIFK